MTKAEEYLYERVEDLTEEKVSLISKINKLVLELEEIDYKLEEMQSELDDAFEVFSPRARKNEFVKGEIENLSRSRDEICIIKEQLENQCFFVDDDINKIREALGEDIDSIDYYYDIPSASSQIEDTQNKRVDMKIVDIYEKETLDLSSEIQKSIMQGLINIKHKCGICEKIVDVDPIRAKLEIETMSKSIEEISRKTQSIVNRLELVVAENQDLNQAIQRLFKIVSYEENSNDLMEKVSLQIEEIRLEKFSVICIIKYLYDIITELVRININGLYITCKNIDDKIRLEIRCKNESNKIENIYNEYFPIAQEKFKNFSEEVYLENGDDIGIVIDI